MGKPGISSDDAAPSSTSTHSLQPLGNDIDIHAVDLPPSYDEAAADGSPSLHDESAYAIPGAAPAYSVLSRTRESTVSLAPALSQNPHQLHEHIARQITLPPRPYLVVRGYHTETRHDGKERKQDTVTDFHVRVDLAETLLTGWEQPAPSAGRWHGVEVVRDNDGQKAFRGGRIRSRAWKARTSRCTTRVDDLESHPPYTDAGDRLVQPEDEPRSARPPSQSDVLMTWCERFCNDPSSVKSFTLHRSVRGFNPEIMETSLTSHIRALNYRGHIRFWAGTSHGSVTVYSPHWINRLRNNGVVFWLCIILQLWIITWPIIWLLERRYEVVRSEWYTSLDTGAGGKIYARGRDEAALAEFWAPAVKHAAWSRRCGGEVLTPAFAQQLQGWTTEQLVYRRADSDAERERRQRLQRGDGTTVDSLVGFVRGVSEVRQDWNLAVGWGADC